MAISRLNLGTTNQVLVKAAAGQTSNLLELQNSSGTVVAGLNQDGVWSGTAEPGLVLLNTTSFSGVSSQSLSNVLSSTYTFYRLVVNCEIAVGAAVNLHLKFRENVTDKSADYYGAGRSNQFNATQADFNLQNNSAQLQIQSLTTSRGGATIDIYRPDATQGAIFGMAYTRPNDAWVSFAGRNSGMTNFTGLTILPASSTITGSVSLYGYNV